MANYIPTWCFSWSGLSCIVQPGYAMQVAQCIVVHTATQEFHMIFVHVSNIRQLYNPIKYPSAGKVTLKMMLPLLTSANLIAIALALPLGAVSSVSEAMTKRDIPADSISDWFPQWNGKLTGTNGLIDCGGAKGGHICDTDSDAQAAARNLVDSVDGGWFRFGFPTQYYYSDPAKWKRIYQIIEAIVDEGNKKGIVTQINLRQPSINKKITNNNLEIAHHVISDLSSGLKGYKNFVLDIVNESGDGGNAPDDSWAEWNGYLVQASREAGHEGFIVIEDAGWSASGLANTGDNGSLFSTKGKTKEYLFDWIKQGNGGSSNHLIASFHLYDGVTPDSVEKEIDAIVNTAKITPQIGEWGNYVDGTKKSYSAVSVTQSYKDKIIDSNGAVLSWCDQYASNGEAAESDNGEPLSHCYGYTDNISSC